MAHVIATEIVISARSHGQKQIKIVTAGHPCILRSTVLEEPGPRPI
jgi:hypothetical protein